MNNELTQVDFMFDLSPGDVIYDIETYPNVFTFTAIHSETGNTLIFEISDRKDDTRLLHMFISKLTSFKCRMVGFNNIYFDYPILHYIYQNATTVSVGEIYKKAQSIIDSKDRFAHIIWEDQRVVEQVDLYQIHHFDNISRATSLKALEIAMKSDFVEALPFDVGTNLNSDQIDKLIEYNMYDVEQTLKFYKLSRNKLKFREELSVKYGKNFANHNDTKIGKDYFTMCLENHRAGSCYKFVNGRKQVVQTVRHSINLGDVILPYIKFEISEFNRILDFYRRTNITQTKGVFIDLNCTIQGLELSFGTGGLHGSLKNTQLTSDDGYIIEDWDVASYYPNLSIVNNLHPEHLGDTFCKIYKDVYEQRKNHAKGTAENAMLKLALNGVYGDSNNQYSPFYDPKYTMAITINGQLSLCMLIEVLLRSSDVQLIQVNTDGLTIRYPQALKEWVHSVTTWWESVTGLQLENALYSRMWVRDVNNYMAEYSICMGGGYKCKGAYEVRKDPNDKNKDDWHKDPSMIVVAKVACEVLKNPSINIREKLQEISNRDPDIHQWILRCKLPRMYKLELDGVKHQNTSRYFISKNGGTLEKVMPPNGELGSYKRANGVLESTYQRVLKEVGNAWDERIHTKNKSKYEIRRTNLHAGWKVRMCNDIRNFSFDDLDMDFYVQEVEKLVNVFNLKT